MEQNTGALTGGLAGILVVAVVIAIVGAPVVSFLPLAVAAALLVWVMVRGHAA